MRRYSANYVYPISQPPIKNGIVEVGNNGVILRIINPGNDFGEIHSTEFHNGVIVPGFINVHCHLELSHLINRIPRGGGISEFIKSVTDNRVVDAEIVNKSIENAIFDLERSGTVAVGDICNTPVTIPFKGKSDVYFHNFIEVFGLNPNSASATIEKAIAVEKEFNELFPQSTSISPHSTYSLSKDLWAKLRQVMDAESSPVSIHFAESFAEYEFLSQGTGPMLERYKSLGIPFDIPNKLSPRLVVVDNIGEDKSILLVHATFASMEELLLLSKHFRKVTLVLCPESNLFIEGQLPNLHSIYTSGLVVAIGTDSLASATTLSMLHQLNIILTNFPEIPFSEVIKWSTLNGADALGIAETYGSLDVGKKPGLNLISNFDFTAMRPCASSIIKKLV